MDNYSQFQLLKDDKVITTAQMSLMQSGFLQRGWNKLPIDTYKGNGRIRHESVVIHIGPLLCIQIHSYQSSEVHDKNAYANVGSYGHFDIYIFRNTHLVGGKPFESINFG